MVTKTGGRVRSFVCGMLIIWLSACSVAEKTKLVAVSNKVKARYVVLVRATNAANATLSQGFNHPWKFTNQQLIQEIDLLIVNKFGWSDWGVTGKGEEWRAEPLFREDVKRRLAQELALAFKNATAADKLAFSVPAQDGQQVRGEIYIENNRLTWEFTSVNGYSYRGNDLFWLDDKDWTIEARDGLSVDQLKNRKVVRVIRDMTVAVVLRPAVAPTAVQAIPAQLAPALVAGQNTVVAPLHGTIKPVPPLFAEPATIAPTPKPAAMATAPVQQRVIAKPVRVPSSSIAPQTNHQIERVNRVRTTPAVQHQAVSVETSSAPVIITKIESRLRAIKKWHDQGLLTRDEYQSQKRLLLQKLHK